MKLGWATGRVLIKNGKGPVLIGKDTRISGYMFESALEAGLSAAGVDIRLLGPIPTPGIAYLTQNTRAQAGIVISASHNPYQDNGIKIFSGDGTKLPDHIELAIEDELEQPLKIVSSGGLGKARRISDAPRRYIEFCKSKFSLENDLNALHIVLDCAHGACYRVAPKVFEELGIRVDCIGTEPDGLNINEGYGATEPGRLRRIVLEQSADLGIALDGDGDRLIMVDHMGELVDGDEALFVIAQAKLDSIKGAVVGTQMSNLALEHAIHGLGLDFLRAQVGDRYVMELLLSQNLRLGGESSGHIINLNLATTGDGIISAVQILEAILDSGKSLHELKKSIDKYPQKMLNICLKTKVNLRNYPEIDKAVRVVEDDIGDRGRVLLRSSGTEPMIRVMVEGEDEVEVDSLVHELTKKVESILYKYI